MQGKTYGGADLERALRSGDLARSAVALTGMVKACEKSGYISFTRAGCDNWVEIPISLIEQAEPRGQQRCRDHTHPVMEITLKEGKDPESQVLAALLMQSGPTGYQAMQYPVQTAQYPTAPIQPQMVAGPVMSSPMSMAIPGGGRMEVRRRNTAQGAQSSLSAAPFSARLGGGFGGLGGLGGLNAWGCWDSCCGSHCAAGHYEAGPIGTVWVCDWYVCDDPCEKCIWPW